MRTCIRTDNYRMTDHAHDKARIEDLTGLDIENAILYGEIIHRQMDAETGEERIATVSPEVLRAYECEFEDYGRRLDDFCTSIQSGLVRTLTSVPFEDLILKVFREGKFLK